MAEYDYTTRYCEPGDEPCPRGMGCAYCHG